MVPVTIVCVVFMANSVILDGYESALISLHAGEAPRSTRFFVSTETLFWLRRDAM